MQANAWLVHIYLVPHSIVCKLKLQSNTFVYTFKVSLSFEFFHSYPSLALSFQYFTINQKFTWRVSKTDSVIRSICVLMFMTMTVMDSELSSSYPPIVFGTRQ